MLLPKEPGLKRRLVYSENIRRRTQNMYNTHNIDLPTTLPTTLPTSVGYGRGIDLPTIETTTLDIPYNNLSIFRRNYNHNQLEETGLNVKMLIQNSSIILHKSNFFCSICHQDNNSNGFDNLDKNSLKHNQILRKLKCNHVFHINCIETWLSKKESCPICRKNLNYI
jgi:hypothetical protein